MARGDNADEMREDGKSRWGGEERWQKEMKRYMARGVGKRRLIITNFIPIPLILLFYPELHFPTIIH